MKRILAVLALVFSACATTPPVTTQPVTAPEQHPEPRPRVDPPAPWNAPPLGASEVPSVFITEWKKAENRATCAPVAFVHGGSIDGAKPRRANFYGGWAVAYDKAGLPGNAASGEHCDTCGRSAYGIAGAGVVVSGEEFGNHEVERMYRDGSRAGWGASTGGGWLADVQIAGQKCLYQVWSNVSEEHLESLVEEMRLAEH